MGLAGQGRGQGLFLRAYQEGWPVAVCLGWELGLQVMARVWEGQEEEEGHRALRQYSQNLPAGPRALDSAYTRLPRSFRNLQSVISLTFKRLYLMASWMLLSFCQTGADLRLQPRHSGALFGGRNLA